MNKEYLNEIIEKIDLGKDSNAPLLGTFDRLKAKEAEIDSVIGTYRNDMFADFHGMITNVKAISDELGVNNYEANLVFLLLLSEVLREYYFRFDIDESVFYDTMRDLKWKMIECRLVYGIYGTFVPEWYEAFFRIYRFTLGRLQFEINKFNNEYSEGNYSITRDDPVLSIHIPRTMERLTRESIMDSFRLANKFFDKILRRDVVPFVLYSWILHPSNDLVFEEGSNLYNFKHMFKMIEHGDFDNYSELWRIFDTTIDEEKIDELPTDTSLRRNFISLMKNKIKTGYGFGILIVERSKLCER